MIADVKDGVMIDGRGSYSIDQQRYNGQFGGHMFWEIKNGKITRQVTNVTYNAITTDFWGNLDAVTGKDEWQMHGTGGDAKGQPTQTNSISHGSPWSVHPEDPGGRGVRLHEDTVRASEDCRGSAVRPSTRTLRTRVFSALR